MCPCYVTFEGSKSTTHLSLPCSHWQKYGRRFIGNARYLISLISRVCILVSWCFHGLAHVLWNQKISHLQIYHSYLGRCYLYLMLFNPVKRQSRLQQMTNFVTSFLIFDKNKVWYYMRIVCQKTILMKCHALFVIFEKAAKFAIVVCCKL